MVLAHITDAWVRPEDRQGQRYFNLVFAGGIASGLFLFLAGVASVMSASAKARRDNDVHAGATAARKRGWEIFFLGLLFRVQAQLLGWGPIQNLFKVDMLNIMGLSIVIAIYMWQSSATRRGRVAIFTVAAVAVSMLTPLVRAVPWLAPLPDPLEAYLRPAGPYAAFPLFPWAGFLFAGALVGELVDAARLERHREWLLQAGIAIVAAAGVVLGWMASYRPALFPTASFWHDSPTFFFIRLGICALTVPAAWLLERLLPERVLRPMAVFGRSSLFVYWIHVEMVYGIVAQPIIRKLPLWGAMTGVVLLCLLLYVLVLAKNRLMQRYELRGPARVFEPVLR